MAAYKDGRSGVGSAAMAMRFPSPSQRLFQAGAPAGAQTAGDGAIRPFQRSLPMLLMLGREAVMQRFRPHLRRHDLTEQQWRIVRVLSETPATDMLSLSERSLIQPSSLSRTVKLLVTRKLVTRHVDREDQRRILVSLTASGRRLFRLMAKESVGIYAVLERDIGPERMADIYRLLDEVIEILGAPANGIAEEP